MDDELSSDTVTAAWVHGAEVAYSWHDSMLKLVFGDMGNQGRIIRGGNIAVRYGTGGISTARNKVVGEFLDRDHPWLWWIDTDMGFDAMTVENLLAAADPVDRPVMGGLCFANREERTDDMGGFVTLPMPTVYQWHQVDEDTGGFIPWVDYPRDEVAQVAGTGAACILIHRSVFERIRDAEGDSWYTPMTHPSMGEMSEDLSFCLRLHRYGIPIHAHTGVRTTHLKPVWISEAVFDIHVRNADRAGEGLPADVPKFVPNRAQRRAKK